MVLSWPLTLTRRSLSCSLSVSSADSSVSLAVRVGGLEVVVLLLQLWLHSSPHCLSWTNGEKNISFAFWSSFSALLLSISPLSSVSGSFLCLALSMVWSSSSMCSIFSIWPTCSVESFSLQLKNIVDEHGELFFQKCICMREFTWDWTDCPSPSGLYATQSAGSWWLFPNWMSLVQADHVPV